MAAIKKNEVRTATLEESEAEAPAENPEIDVSEDEEGVEAKTEDDDEDEEDERPTRSRRAKKANRLKEYQTQADERVRNAEERARQAELVAAHAAGLREAEAQRQQTAQEDPDEAEIKKARQRKVEINTLYNGLSAQEQAAQHEKLQGELDLATEMEVQAIQRRTNRQMGVGRPQDPMAPYRNMVLQRHASDIIQSPPHVQQWGLARYRQLILEGHPDAEETVALAAEQTRKQFGMNSRVASARERPGPARGSMTGASSNGGGGGGNGERKTVTMTQEFKRMAQARFPKLSPDEAQKEWAKVFHKHQEKERRRGA